TRIKICGLSQQQDVLACRDAGADAVGFVFYKPSSRYVSPEQAATLVRSLGPWQTPVALFVNADPSEIERVVALIPNVLLQFHGDETPQFCESFQRPYLKAIRMQEGTDLIALSHDYSSASGLLVDSWSEGFGGSGHTFEWSMLPDLSKMAVPLILSGGLNSNNICQALSQISPYGVDVSSGVEARRGVKCVIKIKEFCQAVQTADFEQLALNRVAPNKQDD
ncbi:MAG: phosphoribosylanthranilate isomerase, partial [Limnobacter sp.]|nr:phosphoribosylanthranilate isomerase [Limnobacter sp.]